LVSLMDGVFLMFLDLGLVYLKDGVFLVFLNLGLVLVFWGPLDGVFL